MVLRFGPSRGYALGLGGLAFGASGGTPAPTPLTAPNVAGTLTNGSTLTATPGSWSSGTATGQWHRDGAPISGQTALTYVYVAATDDGTYLTYVETNGAATSVSNALIAGESNVVYTTAFNGTDGTNLYDYESWVCSTSNSTALRILDNDIACYATSGQNWHKSAGSNNHIVRATIARNASDSTVNSRRSILARSTNPSNYVILDVQSNGWVFYQRAGGVTSTRQAFVTRTLTDGDVAELRVNGEYVQVWFNGVHTSQSVAQNGGLGWNVSDVPAAPNVGIRAEAGASGSISYPFKYFRAFEVSQIPANTITTLSIAVEDVPGSPGEQRIRLTGNITGSITQLQPLVLSSTGQILLDWVDVSGISGSTFDVVTDTLPLGAQGSTATVWLRDETNIETATSSTVAVPILASVASMNVGMNEDFWPGWSTGDPIKDHGARGSWVKSDYGEIPHENIDPTTLLPASYPSGITSLINKAVETGMCKAGDYDITYPPGMTASTTLSNATIVNALSGGTGRVNVAQDVGAQVLISLSGTIPAGGAYVTMTPTGDPDPSVPFTDQILADYTALGGAGPIRFMTPQGINTRLGYDAEAMDVVTATNRLTSRSCTLETMVAICNATGRDLWFCVHHLADDTYIAWAAAYIAANLDPALKVCPEVSNEVWNSLFPQSDWMAWRGTAHGYYNTDGDAAPSSPVLNSGTVYFTPSTGHPTQTFALGERVVGNLEGTGVCMWEALQAVPTGATGILPTSGSNSYWTRIASQTETARARRRYQMERSIEAFDAFDAAFAAEGYSARSRVVRVLGIWSLDTTANILQHLDWQDGYLKTDIVAAAFYVGGGGASSNLGLYASSHVTGWGATEKARYNTDLPQWLTDLFAALNAATDPTIDAAVAMKNGLEAALRAAPYNLAPNTIQLGQYECGQHVVLSGYPNSTDAGTAFSAYRADARLGTWWASYLDKLQGRVGGTHCIFSMLTKNAGLQGWGIMFQQGDQATEQFEAVSDWIAANP